MKTIASLLVLGFSSLTFGATAQEVTAAGNMGTQASWTALKNLIDQANGNAKNALTLAEAIKACGLKGMLYAPGLSGADANGCSTSKIGFLTGKTYTSSAAQPKTFKLPKLSGMDVTVSCNSHDVAERYGERDSSASASVQARIKTLSGWKTLFKDTSNAGGSASASATFRFYEKGGTLYSYINATASPRGIVVQDESVLMPLSSWTGDIEVSAKGTTRTCSIVQGS